MAYLSRPRVTLTVPPELALLDSWGLDVGGEWWALVTFDQTLIPPGFAGHPYPVPCAAWVYGGTVSQPMQPIYYLHVPRIRLGAEPAEWPPPRGRPQAVWQPERSYYFGQLDDGETPTVPPGFGWG